MPVSVTHRQEVSTVSTCQVEYAIEAIKLGSTAIGIQTDEGVILAVEKRITSPLMEPTSIEKVRQQAVFQTRIQSGQWIRIRIGNPNLDPGGQK
jgi:hypothetical protein